MESTILVDLSPASGAHGQRGIGRYVRGLAECLQDLPDDVRSRIRTTGINGFHVTGQEAVRPPPPPATNVGRLPTWLIGRRSVAAALRTSGAQVFHATDPQRPWITRTQATIVTVYDLIPLREREILASWRLDHRVMYHRYLRQIRSASRVIAISAATATDVHERLGVDRDLVDVVYPLVEPPPHPQRLVPPSPTFLVVGALDSHKQPDLALRAFARFRATSESGRLRLIGPAAPSDVDRLRAVANELGIGDSVTIEGRVDDDTLEAAYASATALLMTSRSEGFGLPPVEAVLRGVAVIAVDTPAARETLADAGVIVHADAEIIAAEMRRPRDPSPTAMITMRDRFSRGAVTRALARSYRRVLAGAPGS